MAQRKSVSDRGNWGFFLCSSSFVMELKRAFGYILRQCPLKSILTPVDAAPF
jgi:hypothetical protein